MRANNNRIKYLGVKIMEGWIKLHRKSLTNGWLKNHKLWSVWCYCLLNAAHMPKKTIRNGKQINVLPGQFVKSIRDISLETHMSTQSVRTCMRQLTDCQNLTIESTNKYSLITVNNWASYQYAENTTTNKLTNKQQEINKQLTNKTESTYIDYKNIKKERKEKYKKEKSRLEKRRDTDIFFPPSLDEIEKEFLSQGIEPNQSREMAPLFKAHYDATDWKRGGGQIKRWEPLVILWIDNAKRHDRTQKANYIARSSSPQSMVEAGLMTQEQLEYEIMKTDNQGNFDKEVAEYERIHGIAGGEK